MYFQLLQEMFNEMVLKKDATKISYYYREDFLLYTNGETMNFEEFVLSHQKIYSTPIQYSIAYDKETWVEQGEKIAGRVWITTQRPKEAGREIEVILIAQFKEEKIYRLWELTFPDWSKLPAFEEFPS